MKLWPLIILRQDLDSCLAAAAYFVSSLGGIAIVKLLNYHYCFTSWSVFALLSRSTWVLSFPLQLFLQHYEGAWLGVSWKQLQIYFGVALGLSAVELLNSLSMSTLPGSWYALLKGSDVGVTMVLSILFLRKKYEPGQVVGAVLVMVGIVLVFILGLPPTPENYQSSASTVSLTVAAGLCLMATLLNASCAVLTETILKQTLKEEENRMRVLKDSSSNTPSKLLVSNAYSMWTTFFAFVLLAFPVVGLGRMQSRSQLEVDSTCLDHKTDTTTSQTRELNATAIVIALLLLLGFSRFAERLSKHWICVTDSAVAFSLIQAARRLSGVFILAILFQETFSIGMIAGSACSTIGFVVHYWYGRTPSATTHSSGKGSHRYELVATQPSCDPERHQT